MLIYPNINPIALKLGPLAIHWYGIMYLLGFIAAWGLLTLRAKKFGYTADQISEIIFYGALGIIIGGRLGYMLFYGWLDLIKNPLSLFEVWKGGMSFHGGLLGVIFSLWIYARKIGKHLVDLTDFVAPVVPLGLAAGRIGNFINAELWGRVTTVPWGMIFPQAGLLPRHPSQLYEFFFEGVVMFIILWIYSATPKPRWAVSGLFLLLYGAFRFSLEFFREPDVQIGYLAFGWLTEGQLLSLPMVAIGIFMIYWAYRRKQCVNI